MAGTPHEPSPRRVVGGDQTTSDTATWIVCALCALIIAAVYGLAWIGWL